MGTIFAGICGGVALNIVMLLTFRLIGFGWHGGGILLDPNVQSRKLIAVWTEVEPIPLVVNNPAPIIIGLILFAVGHAFVYRWISPGWPTSVAARALHFATLIFFMCFLFWEFFTPFNLLGEPLHLIFLELVFWAAIALAEAFTIVAIIEFSQDTFQPAKR